MDRGYLKLWRKSMESEVFASEPLWRLWCWCLMKTTYRHRTVPFRTGKSAVAVKLKPGQFIFGRNRAAEILGDKPSTVWKRLKKLESLGSVMVDSSNNQYSIVTVRNWDEYQADEDDKVTIKEQPGDNQVTTKEQPGDNQVTTKEHKQEGVKGVEVKIKDMGKEESPPKPAKRFTPPTIPEIAAYCSERNNGIDPEKFWAHYDATGWMRGKNKIKSWKSCVITWEKNSRPQQKNNKGPQTFAQIRDEQNKAAILRFANSGGNK